MFLHDSTCAAYQIRTYSSEHVGVLFLASFACLLENRPNRRIDRHGGWIRLECILPVPLLFFFVKLLVGRLIRTGISLKKGADRLDRRGSPKTGSPLKGLAWIVRCQSASTTSGSASNAGYTRGSKEKARDRPHCCTTQHDDDSSSQNARAN